MSEVKLTTAEQETIITFSNADKIASCYTYDRRLIKKLDQLNAEHDEVSLVRRGDGFVEYTLPKTWIKINAPRKLTEEQRQNLAAQARKYLQGGA